MEKPPTFPFLLLHMFIAQVCQAEDVLATSRITQEEVTAAPNAPPFNESVSTKQILAAQFECYQKILHDPQPSEPGPYCNRTWDGWLCWGDSPPGTAVQNCPKYFQDFDPEEKVTKVCNPDGQWFRHPDSNRLWSNYTQCTVFTKQKLKFAYSSCYLMLLGYGLSLISLLISVFIFSYFKCLSCQRIILHKNMFASFILHNILTIIWFTIIYFDYQAESVNQIGCKILATLMHYTSCSTYFWMLCEGIYLHTLIIVAVFVGEQQLGWYYMLGWGFPVLPAVLHAVARLHYLDDRCWLINSNLLYIVHCPVHVALVVNLVFLLNIVRVLITKLRVTHRTETNVYMKAVRATLILVPLMGAHFILVPMKPEGRLAHVTYEFFMNVLVSCQGLLVAVILCFANGEVQSAVKRKLDQYRAQCRGLSAQRLVTTDSNFTYHTNTSIIENSQRNPSLEPGPLNLLDERTSIPASMLNGHSKEKQCKDEEKLTFLKMTQI